jgi:hypothetical protein
MAQAMARRRSASGDNAGTAVEKVAVSDVVLLLLPGAASAVVDDTVAVLLIGPVAASSNATTRLKVALALGARVAAVQVTVPLLPTAGVTQLKVGPLFCVSETKVANGGSVSFKATAAALAGPALLTASV